MWPDVPFGMCLPMPMPMPVLDPSTGSLRHAQDGPFDKLKANG
jgi:hypothetical protein